MWRRSENIVHRLFDRQISRAAPNTHIHKARKLYENIVPSFTVYDVECPDYSFRRFSNDGQYLICFSRNHEDLVVYRHNWLTYCSKGENSDIQEELPSKGKKFESYFSQLYSVTLASGSELICKDFFLATDCNCFGIFATATALDSDAPATPGAVPGVPSIERITLYLVRLADGTVVDERNFRDDFIHLAHNMGIFMYDDLLAVLSVRYQAIHILQVREAGMFVDVRTIGAYCREDDELILSSHTQGEALFQNQHTAYRKAKGLSTDKTIPMGSLDAQAKALSLKPIPVNNPGYSGRGQLHDHEIAGILSSRGYSGSGDAPVMTYYRESHSENLDLHDGFLRGISTRDSNAAEASLARAQGNPCRTTPESIRVSVNGSSADQGGSDMGGSSSGHHVRMFGQGQAERSAQWSTGPPTSGNGGYYTTVGPPALYGISYSSANSESQISRRGSQSLYRSSSSDTASNNRYRDPTVSAGSISYGDSGLAGHHQSEGSVEYVVSSRVWERDQSHRQSWLPEASASGSALPHGAREIHMHHPVMGNRHIDSTGVSRGTLDSVDGFRAENRNVNSYFVEIGSGHARPRASQGSTGRSTTSVEMHTVGPSTGRVMNSARTNGNLGTARDVRSGVAGSSHRPASPVRPNQEFLNAREDFGTPDQVGQDAGRGGLLGGMKQRLLSFIFRSIWSQDTDPISRAQRLKRFYYHFQHYVDLVMWKVQFLDRHHLLIKFGSVDGVVSRNSDTSHQTAFFVVYSIESTEILGFHQNSSEEFLQLFEQYYDHFRVAPRYPLYMRFMSSYSNNSSAREQLRKQKAACNNSKTSSYAQVVKRTLASLPCNSQSQSPSAYFDQSLFHFDEKLISATDRHRPCMEHPIKFISRRRPNSLKFKINPGLEFAAGDGRVKRVASFIFHPIFPFAISVQQSFMQPSIVNFHFRR